MTTSYDAPRPEAVGTTPRHRSWTWLFQVACLVTVLGAGLLQLAGRFVGPSLVVLVVALLAALALVRRGHARAAAGVAGVVTLLDLVFHGGLTLAGLLHPEALVVHVLTVAHLAASVAILAAIVPLWAGRSGRSVVPGRIAGVGVVAVLLSVVLGTTAFLTREVVTPTVDDVVVTNDGEVRPKQVRVDVDDPVLVFRNDDAWFPRSFDIDELDVHLTLPPRTARRVRLPEVPATYEFYDVVTFDRGTEGVVVVE